MGERRMHILQVGTFDVAGGAEKVSSNLMEAYRSRGHDAWLAVGRKRTANPDVLQTPNHKSPRAWSRFWWRRHERLQPHYARSWGRWLCRMTHRLAEPAGWLDTLRGIEDFHYPGTRRLLSMTPVRPDVVHCHNLHARYFDLRVLPWLSRQVSTVLTLHDGWMLSGHCAHALDCDRWRTGCGECPDLGIYPAIHRDATARNWRRKRDIYARCRLHVATPSRWLLRRVEQSILAPAVAEARVIPNGVDVRAFRPAERKAVRHVLNIPVNANVLLFTASGGRKNPWKDYAMLEAAVGRVASRRTDGRLLFITLGEAPSPKAVGRADIRLIPFEQDPEKVARYCQAADLYIHAARADTFPISVLEALACGTPVVATAVGGIPEQIKSLAPCPAAPGDSGTGVSAVIDSRDATGILVPPGDARRMAEAIERLLGDDPLRRRLADNARRDALRRFMLDQQAGAYLRWYAELCRDPARDGTVQRQLRRASSSRVSDEQPMNVLGG